MTALLFWQSCGKLWILNAISYKISRWEAAAHSESTEPEQSRVPRVVTLVSAHLFLDLYKNQLVDSPGSKLIMSVSFHSLSCWVVMNRRLQRCNTELIQLFIVLAYCSIDVSWITLSGRWQLTCQAGERASHLNVIQQSTRQPDIQTAWILRSFHSEWMVLVFL